MIDSRTLGHAQDTTYHGSSFLLNTEAVMPGASSESQKALIADGMGRGSTNLAAATALGLGLGLGLGPRAPAGAKSKAGQLTT